MTFVGQNSNFSFWFAFVVAKMTDADDAGLSLKDGIPCLAFATTTKFR